jgi:hypothetical protein
MTRTFKLILPPGFDERAAQEMEWKGWIRVAVEAIDGTRYPVYVSDPIRLQQDLQSATEQGTPWFAEPGLVVVPQLTLATLEQAIDGLAHDGFFNALRPIPSS